MQGQRHANYRLKTSTADPLAVVVTVPQRDEGLSEGEVGEAACYFLEEPDHAKAYITLTKRFSYYKSSSISFAMNA